MALTFAHYPLAMRRARRQFRELHIGEWIVRLGREQREIARAAGITEAYLSNLIAARKKNPGADILLRLSEAMGLTVNDLYRRPPSEGAFEAISGLEPAQAATLARLLDEMSRRTRR